MLYNWIYKKLHGSTTLVANKPFISEYNCIISIIMIFKTLRFNHFDDHELNNLNIKLDKIVDEGYKNKYYQKQNNICCSLMILETLKIKGDTYSYGFQSPFCHLFIIIINFTNSNPIALGCTG